MEVGTGRVLTHSHLMQWKIIRLRTECPPGMTALAAWKCMNVMESGTYVLSTYVLIMLPLLDLLALKY